MTAEIAILNKGAVALAADSAVTWRTESSIKIYNSCWRDGLRQRHAISTTVTSAMRGPLEFSLVSTGLQLARQDLKFSLDRRSAQETSGRILHKAPSDNPFKRSRQVWALRRYRFWLVPQNRRGDIGRRAATEGAFASGHLIQNTPREKMSVRWSTARP